MKDLINLSFLLQFVKLSFQFSNTRFRVGKFLWKIQGLELVSSRGKYKV